MCEMNMQIFYPNQWPASRRLEKLSTMSATTFRPRKPSLLDSSVRSSNILRSKLRKRLINIMDEG